MELQNNVKKVDLGLELNVTAAKYILKMEGAYTENARVAFEHFPHVALEAMQLPAELREKWFAKMAEEANEKVLKETGNTSIM